MSVYKQAQSPLTQSASPKILVMIAGSIAAFKSLSLISKLVQWGAEVEVVLSESAPHFVTPTSIEGLTNRAPYHSLWQQGQAMKHIELNKWADLILLYPASANELQRLSMGLASDLIGSLSLARDFDKPFWVAPAMNPQMWQHPATQKSVNQLRDWGYTLIEPSQGRMACGDQGPGRLVEPEAMFEIIQMHFANHSTSSHDLVRNAPQSIKGNNPTKNIKWLITAGGTREPIDAVRFIGNQSTGKTGADLTSSLLRAGDQVTLLTAATSMHPPKHKNLSIAHYSTFDQLQTQLKQLLAENLFDGVICTAAVSDYSPVMANKGLKHSSEDERWSIELKKNPKLIDHLRAWSISKDLYLVGFKLMPDCSEDEALAAVLRQQAAANPDLIVFNQLKNVSETNHQGRIWKKSTWVHDFSHREELAHLIRADFLSQSKINVSRADLLSIDPNADLVKEENSNGIMS